MAKKRVFEGDDDGSSLTLIDAPDVLPPHDTPRGAGDNFVHTVKIPCTLVD